MNATRPVRVLVVVAMVAAAVPFAATAHAGTAVAAVPVVTSVSPSSGSPYGGTSVTITGTGFTGATHVDFGMAFAATFDVVSDTEITATSPVYNVGAVPVEVDTPGGDSANTAASTFTFVSDPPAVTSVSPVSALAAGGARVTITGTGFDPESDDDAVFFGNSSVGGSSDVVVLSATATQLVVIAPVGVAGAVDVRVTTRGGTSPDSAGDAFTYLPVTPIIAVEGENASLYVSAGGRPFVSYGGVLTGAPSIVSSSDRNFYFVRGRTDDLYVRTDKTAFTHLRPHTPLVCATAPAAVAEADNSFAVACIGNNGLLYTATGTLPTTGNPVITSTVQRTVGGFDSDLTAVKGGVGTDEPYGDFVVDGKPYAGSGSVTVSSGLEPYSAGNTYAFSVRADGTTEPFGAGPAGQVGGTCSGAPSRIIVLDGYDLTCTSVTSRATFAYSDDVDEVSNSLSAITFTRYLGGTAVGSPVTTLDDRAGNLDILVTGTDGRLYAAVAGFNPSGFRLVPISSVAASGPAISSGPPPADTTAAH